MENIVHHLLLIQLEVRIYSLTQYELVMIFAHYYLLYKQKVAFLGLGLLIAGFYIATIVFGNHEREKRYKTGFMNSFLQHQL